MIFGLFVKDSITIPKGFEYGPTFGSSKSEGTATAENPIRSNQFDPINKRK